MISPDEFSIDLDTTGDDYGVYDHGGRVRQVKQPHDVTFVSVLASLIVTEHS